MGITGLIPFIQKASRQINIDEFSGCTVAIDSYCWLHKGAFACADKLVRGEETDVYVNYCLKYVRMLLSKNIKPILVFDGRHLPAKAQTEAKRRESRDISKKRAAELLSLGKTEEARSYMRRSVDITHAMALRLIKECRKRNVDCIVAPYEADAQLAYLNIKNIAHIVITEDSDLVLFGCTKVLFKMDMDGTGVLVETVKLPLVMRCPIEHYQFDKFRRMCIMSGCDYLPSLPGIGLAKARQFVNATQDSNFANALRKLPSFFNKMSLTVTDGYREDFLKAEATFKHQYVYDPIDRRMVRLTEPDDEDVEEALCVNAGKLLAPHVALQLALGNLNPFTLNRMDDWCPETDNVGETIRTNGWKDKTSTHASIWRPQFKQYLDKERPWQKKMTKPEPIIGIPQTRQREKVVNMVSKYVPETEDESLTIESLSNMYCVQPAPKKSKTCDTEGSDSSSQNVFNKACTETEIIREISSPMNPKSPILENKERSFRKWSSGSYSVLKRISKFPRTSHDDKVVESKFFNATTESAVDLNNAYTEPPLDVNYQAKSPEIDGQCSEIPDSQAYIEESPKTSKNPFKMKPTDTSKSEEGFNSSQKENAGCDEGAGRKSPVFGHSPRARGPLKLKFDDEQMFEVNSELSVIENTYPYEELITPVDSQGSFGESQCTNPTDKVQTESQLLSQFRRNSEKCNSIKKSKKVVGVKRPASMRPNNQQTLLGKYGFQKKPAMKR